MMSKISIVSLRRERNKARETPALLRAEKRVFGEPQHLDGDSDYLENEEPLQQAVALGSAAYQFDVALSPEHIDRIMSNSKNAKEESTVDPSVEQSNNGNEPGSPVIFRFTVMPPKLDQTLTSEDICQILQISRRTLYRYVKENQLNCVRINSQLRFLREDVRRFLDDNKS